MSELLQLFISENFNKDIFIMNLIDFNYIKLIDKNNDIVYIKCQDNKIFYESGDFKRIYERGYIISENKFVWLDYHKPSLAD